jgi:hypothetical protein
MVPTRECIHRWEHRYAVGNHSSGQWELQGAATGLQGCAVAHELQGPRRCASCRGRICVAKARVGVVKEGFTGGLRRCQNPRRVGGEEEGNPTASLGNFIGQRKVPVEKR